MQDLKIQVAHVVLSNAESEGHEFFEISGFYNHLNNQWAIFVRELILPPPSSAWNFPSNESIHFATFESTVMSLYQHGTGSSFNKELMDAFDGCWVIAHEKWPKRKLCKNSIPFDDPKEGIELITFNSYQFYRQILNTYKPDERQIIFSHLNIKPKFEAENQNRFEGFELIPLRNKSSKASYENWGNWS